MFDSTAKILDQYIKIGDRHLGRFDIHSIETVRGENPSDLYYICNVRKSWFIIFETDYVFSLAETLHEAAEIFESHKGKLTHWVAKRNEYGEESALPLDAATDKTQYDRLVLDIEGTYLRCAVLAVNVGGDAQMRFDPTAYGYSA